MRLCACFEDSSHRVTRSDSSLTSVRVSLISRLRSSTPAFMYPISEARNPRFSPLLSFSLLLFRVNAIQENKVPSTADATVKSVTNPVSIFLLTSSVYLILSSLKNALISIPTDAEIGTIQSKCNTLIIAYTSSFSTLENSTDADTGIFQGNSMSSIGSQEIST